jgi:hypothetical protein
MRRSRIVWCGLLALAWLGSPLSASASDEAVSGLLLLLRDRGVISEAEYQELLGRGEAPAPAGTPRPAGEAPAEAPEATQAASARPAAEAAEEPEEPWWSIFRRKEVTDETSPGLADKPLPEKWYDRLSFRGYTQLRLSEVVAHDGPALEVPNDRSVRENESFLIRRGRLVLSGDATQHLFVYAQADFNASTGASDYSLQMRDLYGDIALDEEKEFRFRIGQSKVPFGWVNLQSSQNRGPLERPDALNSAAEGERDVGVSFLWAPAEIRKRYRELVSRGLKGSGDYGVFSFGAYSGQGPNRGDQNGRPHWVARVSYPFELPSGQLFEVGVQGYHGRFVSPTDEIPVNGVDTEPSQPSNGAIDQRVGVTFVWYPQPFGLEAEWNWGRGPELRDDLLRIDSEFLHGGYVQGSYRAESPIGIWYPFTRWNYYEGGRKFGTNAPAEDVNELDAGLEWAPWPELELTLMYTHTFERTNTRKFPYDDTRRADRLGAQLQWNF